MSLRGSVLPVAFSRADFIVFAYSDRSNISVSTDRGCLSQCTADDATYRSHGSRVWPQVFSLPLASDTASSR